MSRPQPKPIHYRLAALLSAKIAETDGSMTAAALEMGMTKNMLFRMIHPGRIDKTGREYGVVQKLEDVDTALRFCGVTFAALDPPADEPTFTDLEMMARDLCAAVGVEEGLLLQVIRAVWVAELKRLRSVEPAAAVFGEVG